MLVNIRQGKVEDLAAVHQLVMELAAFEKAPEEVLTNPNIFANDAFGERDNFKFIVAETADQEIVGICIFYVAYSSWKGRILFLDDIVITEVHRNKGIGKLMMSYLFDYCQQEKMNQMRWQVLDWNENAIKFYETLGAVIDKEWYTCKMNFYSK